MSFSIRSKSNISCFYRTDHTIIIIISLSTQDIICLTFIMMLMISKRTSWFDRHFCI